MRNNSIDVLKLFLAFLVVIIHVWFAHRDYTLPISRCAVPCFFLISGYFTYDKEIKRRLQKSLRRIMWICIWATLVYSPLICTYLFDIGFNETAKRLLFWITLNEVPNVPHLWYLYSYLVTIGVVYLFDRWNLGNVLLWCSPFLILISVICGKYSSIWCGFDVPFQVTRNFVFTGVPFFCIGMLIRKKKPKMNPNVLLCLILMFSAASIAESLYTREDITGDMYFATPFLAISLLLYVINKPSDKLTIMSKLGAKYSLYIYIFHPYVLIFYREIISNVPNNEILTTVNNHAMPAVIFGITLLFVFFLDKMKITKFLR